MNNQQLAQARIEILARASQIKCPFNVSEELQYAYSVARSVDKFLVEEYFPIQNPPSENEKIKQLKSVLAKFEQDVIDRLLQTKENFDSIRETTRPAKQNLFLLAGTKNLFLSNKYTRTISTTLGNRLEHVIDIDRSKCFDTETYFNLKVRGVDKFVLDSNGNIRHIQVKTKKDTLTGSQAKRSVIELGIHPHPIFAALFDFGGWNFPRHDKIARMAGNEFWDLVGLAYEDVLEEVCNSLQRIEKQLY